MILHWNDETFECEYAVKKIDSVYLYDSAFKLIRTIFNIPSSKWDQFTIENGNWTQGNLIPTETEMLKADVDFLLMENETLSEENAQLRADVDYLLMLQEA